MNTYFEDSFQSRVCFTYVQTWSPKSNVNLRWSIASLHTRKPHRCFVSSTSLQLGTSNLWFSNIVTTNGSTQFCQNFKHRILFNTNFGLGRIKMFWFVSSNKTFHCMARFLSSTLFNISSLVWILQEDVSNNSRKMSSTPANPELRKWSQHYRRLGWRCLNFSATVIFITQNSYNKPLPPRKFYDFDSSGQLKTYSAATRTAKFEKTRKCRYRHI